MRFQPQFIERMPHPECEDGGLYRFIYVGGPVDGLVSTTDTPPVPCQDIPTIPSEPPVRGGSTASQRIAQYRWKSTQLIKDQGLPVVIVRYEYRGSVTMEATPTQPRWKRTLAALRLAALRRFSVWVCPAEPHFGTHSAEMERSYVQD